MIRPRLTDARFFYQADRGRRLEQRLEGLDTMLFEKRLGSLGDKTRRVVALAMATILAAGCATYPTGPSVTALPGTQSSFDQFQADDLHVCVFFCRRRLASGGQSRARTAQASSTCRARRGA